MFETMIINVIKQFLEIAESTRRLFLNVQFCGTHPGPNLKLDQPWSEARHPLTSPTPIRKFSGLAYA